MEGLESIKMYGSFFKQIIDFVTQPWFILTLAAALIAAAVFLFFKLKSRLAARSIKSTACIGAEFEKYCAKLLKLKGFKNIELTRATGDFGVDILAQKDGVSWAFQCKSYDTAIGPHAVMEVYSGKAYYDTMVGAVITDSVFTANAIEMAEKLNIILWDCEKLEELERSVGL